MSGTYIFALDDDRNVDATESGSMAHLINHSCNPNCFTRIINADKDSRIVIFTLTDLEVGVELTYDYRFTSQNEHLSCNCGAPTCRGMVNELDPEQGFMVPRSELSPWDEKSVDPHRTGVISGLVSRRKKGRRERGRR